MTELAGLNRVRLRLLSLAPLILAALFVACGADPTVGGDASPSPESAPRSSDETAPPGTVPVLVDTDPASPGPYGAGFVQLTLLRNDSLSGELRELPTILWYPTDAAAEIDPNFAASERAPIAEGPDPWQIIVFSHGAGGSP
ncbi:MAG TPA: hypothetical protein QGF05_03315, partial [Dehalococcoidia bacterium]|nr:hypothetical protein [Dehalococcoidia bacterium]